MQNDSKDNNLLKLDLKNNHLTLLPAVEKLVSYQLSGNPQIGKHSNTLSSFLIANNCHNNSHLDNQ